LRWALEKRKTTVGLGLAFLVFSMLLFPRIGTEFLPALEEGNLWIRASMPSTISLEAGVEQVKKMREILKTHPEVITVVSQHGRPDDGSDPAGFYNVELFVTLKPFEEWRSGYVKSMLVADVQQEFYSQFPGIEFNFSQYIQDNVEEGLSGVKGANSVKIIGPDLAVLEKLADQVLHEMNGIKGVEDLGVFHVLGQPNLNIKIDREERPDIDAVYMKAVQIMTGQGGWPMNIVALPRGSLTLC
jgi:cobalt-zinc-cadmium resistance protein CzcA